MRVISTIRYIHSKLTYKHTSSLAGSGTELTFASWLNQSKQKVHGKFGQTILDIAQDHNIPLEGACEGSLSCSTCHVIFATDEQYKLFPPPCEDELDMLDVASCRTKLSRLSCCLTLNEQTHLDIIIPPSTNEELVNFEEQTRIRLDSDSRVDSTLVDSSRQEQYEQSRTQEDANIQFRNTSIALRNLNALNQEAPSMNTHPCYAAATSVLRLSEIAVSITVDPGENDTSVTQGLVDAVSIKLGLVKLQEDSIKIIRKSLDARKRRREPHFIYVVDVDFTKLDISPRFLKLLKSKASSSLSSTNTTKQSKKIDFLNIGSTDKNGMNMKYKTTTPKQVFVIGAGPAGLFAALKLAQANVRVTLIERGQAVDRRGVDIGAMYINGKLNAESNMCYGMGGAGTWSDGKLTTRIGKNSDKVRNILETLVLLGAPKAILQQGKPHLGTDRMIKILRNMKLHLEFLGVDLIYGEKVESIQIKQGKVSSLVLSSGKPCPAEKVILGIGHSARDFYERMYYEGQIKLEFQPFSVGFRGEHPQSLINDIRYGKDQLEAKWSHKLPVADYRLVAKTNTFEFGGREPKNSYSFCMCPGGQVVPTALNPNELCVNGMSFSKRSSQFANSGLVVPVTQEDCFPFITSSSNDDGVLAGLYFQRMMEQDAAMRGGGDLVAPVQSMVDFVEGTNLTSSSTSTLPQSSYRLGIKKSNLHEIYPYQITEALRQGLIQFNKEMPGYLSHQGLLHGVETRTSAPIKIVRDKETLQSPTASGLFPIGEGAGYAGGIVSAAVDGVRAADKILHEIL